MRFFNVLYRIGMSRMEVGPLLVRLIDDIEISKALVIVDKMHLGKIM
jgi:hypothetical protein